MTNKNLKFILITIAALLLFSCGKEETGSEGVKVIPTNITVPSAIEIEAGQDINLVLRGTTNITTGDQIILRNVAGQDISCPISEMKDRSYLKFTPPTDIASGHYKLYVRSNSTNYYVSEFDLSVLSKLVVEPAAGVNVYGLVLCDGKGVPGVLVSDGAEIVSTDANGIYQLKSDKKWQYVFVIIPSGYKVPLDGVLPQFHTRLTQSTSVAERKDFELKKVSNDNFNLYVLGDMHLAKRNGDISQFGQFAKSLNSSMSSASGSNYVLTLGDMTWDLYWYSNSYEFPQYLETVNSNFKDVAFFHTMGNHDNDMNSTGDFDKAFKYSRDIAPTYYSFNLGKIHFIVLDNIDYNDTGTGSDNRKYYARNFTAEQMAWLAKDLSHVDKSTPVFISSHAPVTIPSGAKTYNESYLGGANSAGEGNKEELLAAVAGYDVHFLSGHTHNLFNRTHSSSFTEHNLGAVCACWWWTGHLTSGIHVSQDGTPGGFSVWNFKGKEHTHYFQATGHDAAYQFRAYDVNKVKEVYDTQNAKVLSANSSTVTPLVSAITSMPNNAILVNVWDWDPSWTVSISENGKELSVSQVYTCDPLHMMSYTFPRSQASTSLTFATTKWNHYFQATASSNSSTVTVKVTDRNGKTYSETMARPKAFTTSEYINK